MHSIFMPCLYTDYDSHVCSSLYMYMCSLYFGLVFKILLCSCIDGRKQAVVYMYMYLCSCSVSIHVHNVQIYMYTYTRAHKVHVYMYLYIYIILSRKDVVKKRDTESVAKG